MMENGFSVRDILARTLALLRRNGIRAAFSLVVLAAAGMAVDSGLAGRDERALNLAISLASLALQYWLTRALLDDLGVPPRQGAAFPAFFGLSFLSVLAILLGLLLGVVPGIVLMVRWSVANPILLASDEGVVDALRRSWERTQGHFWPIFFAFVLVYGAAMLAVLAGVGLEGRQPDAMAGTILANLALAGGQVVGWHVSVAIYSFVEPSSALGEVFE